MKGCRFFLQSLFQSPALHVFVFLLTVSVPVYAQYEPSQITEVSQSAIPVPFGTTISLPLVKDHAALIQVKDPASALVKLQLQPETASGMAGKDLSLNAVMVDSKGKERTDIVVEWKSDNPTIATVNANGLVSLKSAGAVTIIAVAEGKTATASLIVMNPPIAKIEISPTVLSLGLGEGKQLDAVILDANHHERKEPGVVWNTSSASVASVSDNGIVTGQAAGSVLITASVTGITSNPVSVTVQAQSAPSGRPSKTELKNKFKDTDPSKMVYFSGITDEIAGTGDSTKFAGEAEQAGLSQHPLALELADLPKDRYGLIDWATAIKTEKVKPRHSLDPKSGPDEIPLQLDVVIFTKSQFQPDVIFPHFVHTLWLTCTNCHPAIFPMNAKEANKIMTMPKIAAGEFCGRCHNRVAFPLSDCLRCHVKLKDTPPVDPDYQVVIKGRSPK
jgi:c(7)-type cytochrome triheme protein